MDPASISSAPEIKSSSNASKLLKIDTNAVGELDLDLHVSHKGDAGNMFEKSDDRGSPLSTYHDKRRFLPVVTIRFPTTAATHNSSWMTLITQGPQKERSRARPQG